MSEEKKNLVTEPLTKENYAQKRRALGRGYTAALFVGVGYSIIPALILWVVISVYDGGSDGYTIFALLFGGIPVIALGIIWYAAIECIAKTCRERSALREAYRGMLTPEELGALAEKRRIREVILCCVVGAAGLVWLVVFAVNSRATVNVYNEAVLLVESGAYEEAIECFEKIEKKDYHDTSAYIALCEAHLDYAKGNIKDAYADIEYKRFSYLSPEQSEAIDEFKTEIESAYDEYLAEQKAAEEAAKKATAEKEAEERRQNESSATSSTKKNSGGKSYSSGKTWNSDPDPSLYYDAEDFYYDYYDDFWDYEDAEEFYDDYWD